VWSRKPSASFEFSRPDQRVSDSATPATPATPEFCFLFSVLPPESLPEKKSKDAGSKNDQPDNQGKEGCNKHAGGTQVFRVPRQWVPFRFEKVNGSLKRRVQRFSTQDQSDHGDQRQPFDRGYSEIAGETERSNSGYQMNSEIPLSQTEQEEPAAGVPETLGTATDPSKNPI